VSLNFALKFSLEPSLSLCWLPCWVYEIYEGLPYRFPFFSPSGNSIVSNAKINIKLNSTPFRPPPTTNQPSLKWTKTIPDISTKMVTIDAHFTYFSNIRQKAETKCDSLIDQAIGTPSGAKPIWFKYKFPKSFMPLLNIPGILCANRIMAIAKQAVEHNFSKTSKNPIIRNIEFNSVDKVLHIDYDNGLRDMDSALVFERKFFKIKKSIEIDHTYCILPLAYRGKGYIKPVFRESLEQYINCGAKKIRVHAGFIGGGYVWAKYGFRAVNKADVEIILDDAQKKLNAKDFVIIEKIYNGYYTKNPGGKSFPMNLWAALDFMKPVLLGSDWKGELDLKNKLHLEKFKEYVYR